MAKLFKDMQAQLKALLAGADPDEVFTSDGPEAGAIAYYDGKTYEIDGKHYTQAEYEAWERANMRSGANTMLIWHEEVATAEELANMPPPFYPEAVKPKASPPKLVETTEQKRARVLVGLAERRRKAEEKEKAKQKKLEPPAQAQYQYEFILSNMVSLSEHREFNHEINRRLNGIPY